MNVAEGPSHLLDRLHVLKCGLHRFGGCAHSLHGRLTSSLGGGRASSPHVRTVSLLRAGAPARCG